MKKNIKKGFTLIELLIVIAIIGILASIVLVSVTPARKRTNFASFKTSMQSVIAGALLCRDENKDVTAGAAGAVICTGSESKYPSLPAGCTNSGDFAVSAGNTDNWVITNTCITGQCDAQCFASGCVWPSGC